MRHFVKTTRVTRRITHACLLTIGRPIGRRRPDRRRHRLWRRHEVVAGRRFVSNHLRRTRICDATVLYRPIGRPTVANLRLEQIIAPRQVVGNATKRLNAGNRATREQLVPDVVCRQRPEWLCKTKNPRILRVARTTGNRLVRRVRGDLEPHREIGPRALLRDWHLGERLVKRGRGVSVTIRVVQRESLQRRAPPRRASAGARSGHRDVGLFPFDRVAHPHAAHPIVGRLCCLCLPQQFEQLIAFEFRVVALRRWRDIAIVVPIADAAERYFAGRVGAAVIEAEAESMIAFEVVLQRPRLG